MGALKVWNASTGQWEYSAGFTNVLTWHAVGTTGEPPFQNGWSNNSPGDTPTSFAKDILGMVHLRGVVSGGTIGASTPVFVFPAGARPIGTLNFGTTGNGAGATQVRILSTGECSVTFGPAQWVSLAGVSFYAEL